MSNMEYSDIRVVKKANIYFDGKVTSRTIFFKDGSKKTLGVMLPGDYEFDTNVKEIMEIQQGELDVLLPGEKVYKSFKPGDTFEVPAKAVFKLKVKTVTDYCCSYLG